MHLSRGLIAPLLICAACTFTGLGNYNVTTCQAQPGSTVGSPIAITMTASNPDFTFTSASGASPTAAFVADLNPGICLQAVNPGASQSGYIGTTCSFFAGTPAVPFTTSNPRQPWAVPMSAGYAVTMVATTGPCTQGQISFEYDPSQGTATPGAEPTCESTGASLPSLAPLGKTSSIAIAAWYQTSITLREDPIQSCGSAKAASLVVSTVDASKNPAQFSFDPTNPKTLSTNSISVRPAATLYAEAISQVVVAAPHGNDVGVWTLDSTLASTKPTTTIPGLAGARAVAIAADTPGKRFAVVAEIGCNPQSIALAVGTLQGFSHVTTVAPSARSGNNAQIQPTVAWVPANLEAPDPSWVVSWIYVDGPSTHALAMRFDVDGNPVGGVIDPQINAIGAIATSDGNVMGYVPSQGKIVTTSLGCAF